MHSPWMWFTQESPVSWPYDDDEGIASAPRRLCENSSLAFANKSRIVEEVKSYHEALAKEQRGPYTGKSSVPYPDNFLMHLGAVHWSTQRAQFDHREAILALIQTEVALRRYRFDHGRYPEKLSGLTPAYLKKAPVDPFGGKGLKYLPAPDGRKFTLYSVGPDLRDNGGRPFKGSISSCPPGDILLRNPQPPTPNTQHPTKAVPGA